MMLIKPKYQARARVLIFLCAISCFTGFDIGLWANPTGETVVAGNAAFDRTGNSLLITTGKRTIINWQDFSIATGELTKFIQPSASSATLNRVLGGNLSSIYGSLQSNGQVYLINPNGILIGPNGRIDTGGFLASTLDTTNAEFLKAGDLKFVGASTAPVVNQGTINVVGGDVFMIGRRVENSGNIAAPNGTVGLAAGSEVLLAQKGNERIFVQPSASLTGSGSGTGVANSGSVKAIQAELKASGNMYALAINNAGTIRATGAVQRGGRILLVGNGGRISNTGRLTAKNANGSGGKITVDAGVGGELISTGLIDASGTARGTTGGAVQLLGDNVGLTGFAKVDVSGDAGGGTALIGGDLHGANPLVRDALHVFMGSDATIDAGAITSGNGGKVVLWSNNATRFYGSINARGGATGGNGGFVEISSKDALVFEGKVAVPAPKGNAGTLLLDPMDILISGTNSDENSFLGWNQSGAVLFADADADSDTYHFDPSAFDGQSGNIVLQAQHDITLDVPLDLTSIQTAADRFVLQAGHNLTITSNGSLTTNAAIFLEADSPHLTGTAAGTGILTIAGPVSSVSGKITLIGSDFNITAPVVTGVIGSVSGVSSNSGSPTVICSGTLPTGLGVGSYLLGQRITAIASGTLTLKGNANATMTGGTTNWIGSNPASGNFTTLYSGTNSGYGADVVDYSYNGVLPPGFGIGSVILGQTVVSIDPNSETFKLSGKANQDLLGGNASFITVNPIWISTSDQSNLTLGTGGKLTPDEIDLLNSNYQVLIGKAVSAGSDGQGLDARTLVAGNIEVQNSALVVRNGSLVLQAQNDITVDSNASIVLNSGQQKTGATNRLVLQAGRNIDLEGPVTTGGADIYLEANSRYLTTGTVGTLTINAPVSSSWGGYIQLQGADFSINSTVDSGGSRSTRLCTSSTDATLTIGNGPGDLLSGGEIDMLISTSQVWIGRAENAGANGDGGAYVNGSQYGIGAAETIAGTLAIDTTTVLHTRATVCLFTSGSAVISAPLTTLGPTTIDGRLVMTGGGASINNTSGGLVIGCSNPGFAGIRLGGGTPIPGGINLTAAQLQSIKTPRLTICAGGTNSNIEIDGITGNTSIGSFAFQTGSVAGDKGDIEFVSDPSVFKSLSIYAAGGVNVSSTLTVTSGGLSIYADRFGTLSGTFTNSAPVILPANQALLIQAADVSIGARLSSASGSLGSVTLQPSTPSLAMQVGGVAAASGTLFSILQSDLDNMGNYGASSISSLIIGQANGLNRITFMSPLTFYSPVTIRGGTLLGSLGTAAAPVTVPVTLINSTPVMLGVSIYTNGQKITVQSPALLAADTLFSTSGTTGGMGSGDTILFNSTLNDTTAGQHALTLNAGTSGNIVFANQIGNTTRPGAISGTGNNITLTTASIAGGLNFSAAGTLLEKGTLTVAGSAALAGNNITLLTTNVGGGLNATAGAALLETGPLTVGGTASLTGNNITLQTTSVGASLGITAAGTLLEKGVLTVGGTAMMTGNNVTLNTTNVGSYLGVTATNTLSESGYLKVGNTAVLEGKNTTLSSGSIGANLSVTARGTLTEAGPIIVGSPGVSGSASFVTTNPGTALSLSSANHFYVPVSLATAGNGNATLVNNNATILAPMTAIGNNFTLTTSGSVTQAGALVVPNILTIKAAGYDINLTGSSNSFGSVAVTGNNVTLNEMNSTQLLASTVAKALVVTSGGDITQANGSILSVTGASTFNTNNSVILPTSKNHFVGRVGFFGLTGSGSAPAGVTLNNNTSTILAGGLSVGNLNLTASGSISQLGVLNVTGTLSASATGLINLGNTSNSFTTIGDITHGSTLTLIDGSGGLTLAGTIGGAVGADVTIITFGGNLLLNLPGAHGATAITGRHVNLATNATFINNSYSKINTRQSNASYGWWRIYSYSQTGTLNLSDPQADQTVGGLLTGGPGSCWQDFGVVVGVPLPLPGYSLTNNAFLFNVH